MNNYKPFSNIKDQAAWCLSLMYRLNDDIQTENDESPWSVGCKMKNKIQKQSDVKRLRRELLKLENMLE